MSQRKTEVDSLNVSPWLITRGYIGYAAVVLVFYGLLWLIARDSMVMSFDELWKPAADIGEAFTKVWFIFVWPALAVGLAGVILAAKGHYREHDPAEIFFKGLWSSLNAGFFEEIIFRWIIFFSAMVVLRVANTVTFGVVEWFSVKLFAPFANWLTFGALEAQLLDSSGWLLGAATLLAKASFQEGHKYLGPLGQANAWFIGMVMFWLLFNYGLLAAILVHIAYDALVYTVRAITSLFQPKKKFSFRC